MKKMLIFAAVAVGIGIILALIGFGLNGFCLPKGETETNTYTIEESFTDISVDADIADIRILPAEGDRCTVVCKERQEFRFSINTEKDTLAVTLLDTRKWYEKIFTFFQPNVTLYLPKTEYGTLSVRFSTGDLHAAKGFLFDSVSFHGNTGKIEFSANAKENLSIKNSTGSVYVSGTTCSSLDIRLTTGDIKISDTSCTALTTRLSTGNTVLTNTTCSELQHKSSTGNITLTNSVSFGKIDINTSTGNVRFNGSDGTEITVQTSTGDITGTLVTPKIFFTHTDTGRIRVPQTMTGGRCELTTDTGNILLDIAPPDSTVPDEVFETAPLIDPPAQD